MTVVTPRLGLITLLLSSTPLAACAFSNPRSFSSVSHARRSFSPIAKCISLSASNDDDASTKAAAAPSETRISAPSSSSSSKREMLKFAIPALGIYLTNPLLSNIDNAFVGRTVGPAGLAALSPATLCIDQALYLFSFLSRATTGLVSRAFASSVNGEHKSGGGNTDAARDAASAPLTVSFFCGAILSLVYAFFTPNILKKLKVDPLLQTSATSYIHWRGAIAWAALAQSVSLSLFIVTKDAITPLKIISCAAILNVIGDAAFCVWPLRGGCGGAAAATALATLVSTGWMVKSLKDRKLWPKLRLPKKKEFAAMSEFTGPLLLITFTRMGGFMNMQKKAMSLGVEALAGYQLCMNLMLFFILFGEPLSQLGQTKLPAIIDANDSAQAKATFKSIITLSTFAAFGVAAVAYLTATFGSGMFSSAAGVQAIARSAAPALLLAVAQTIVGIAADGCLMASRDFGFMLYTGIGTFLLQTKLLQYCNSVGDILMTFTVRLGMYSVLAVGRTAFGYGNLGRAIHGKSKLVSSTP
mmetsp:Transcript_22563/g.47296  ORF Transcript_22563/g.47296 Transcript_22563/m.47296 type:complete len:528 (-) Transcript_22563:1111-2694(-)